MRKSILKFALIIPVLAGLCFTTSADNAKKNKKKVPEITTANNVSIDEALHDFGTIKESDGNVTTVFTVTNNSKKPIVLQQVKISCGCTAVSYTKEPIEKGKTGEVKAVYKPKGRPGPFEKTITITIAASDQTETVQVKIKGKVEP
ncbi:MAG: DUF1573 domain-containing protein [Dysgonamonadaceae bacterium]|jgi:hypothetical protein|nr:DUF1573 domain-containing protein [Dysgonamonadaceae bacterium]